MCNCGNTLTAHFKKLDKKYKYLEVQMYLTS